MKDSIVKEDKSFFKFSSPVWNFMIIIELLQNVQNIIAKYVKVSTYCVGRLLTKVKFFFKFRLTVLHYGIVSELHKVHLQISKDNS